MQPAWVHTAVNASNESACGWVITIFWLPRILRPSMIDIHFRITY